MRNRNAGANVHAGPVGKEQIIPTYAFKQKKKKKKKKKKGKKNFKIT